MYAFVDNIASLVVEHCLVDELANVFNPTTVNDMDDSTRAKLAAESEETLLDRQDLEDKISVLDAGLATCLRHISDTSPGKSPLPMVDSRLFGRERTVTVPAESVTQEHQN